MQKQKIITHSNNENDSFAKNIELEGNILKSIISSANDAIIMIDNSGNIILWNNAATIILGFSKKEVIGKNLHQLITPDRYKEAHKNAFSHFQTSGKGADINKTHELIALHKNKTEIPIELSLSTLKIEGQWCSVGIVRDISERKLAEEKLLQSRQKYRSVIDNMHDAFYRTNNESLIIMASPSIERITGYTQQEILTKKSHDLFENIDDRNKLAQLLSKSNHVVNYLVNLKRKDLSIVNVEININVLRDNKNVFMGSEGIIKDVTERIKNQKEITDQNKKFIEINAELSKTYGLLSKSESQLKETAKKAKLGSWKYNFETNEIDWSEETYRIHRIPYQSNADIKKAFDIYHYDDQKRLKEKIQLLKEKGKSFSIDTRIFKTKENYSWIQIAGEPIYKSNKITGITGTVQNINTRKIAEAQLAEQKLLFETMFNTISDGVVITDTSRKIILANKGMETTFGYLPNELIGKTTELLYAEQSNFEKSGTKIFNKEAEANDLKYITYYKNKEGKIFPGETFANKLYNKDRKWIGNLGIMRNVSERINFINELKESNSTKDKLFSIISHDLRSPFNSILGFSELLANEVNNFTTDEVKTIAKSIHTQSNNAFDLLNKVLNWSQSQLNKLDPKPETIKLRSISDHVILEIISQAKSKNIIIENSIDGNQDIYADYNMVETIFRNLLTNAIKFTPQSGTIQLTSKADFNKTIISVKDSGIGIPKEKLETLLLMDKVESTRGTNNESGTGLGLSICKEFVEINGGTIGIESKIGEGSVFYFSLPLPKEVK